MPDMAATTTGPRQGTPLVALLVDSFLPYSQTFIYAQVANYRRYEPDILARRRANTVQFPETRVCALVPGTPLRYLEATLQAATGFSPTFLARLRVRRHDLLHAQFGGPGLLALPLCQAVRIPLIVTFRGRDVARMAGRSSVFHRWLASRRRRLFSSAARILAVSADIAQRLTAMGAPPDRVQVWRVGISIPEGPYPLTPAGGRAAMDPLRVLMAGRFVEKKGFEYGIEAFARLVRSGHDARLTVVGDGTRRRQYETLIRRCDMADRIDLPGILSHRALLDRIAAADIVVVPSITARRGDREGVPNVLKEASARAVPVIGTRHGGIPDAIDEGRTGLLVPERDTDALVRALRTLAGDHTLRARLGTAGREKMAREFDVRRQVAELEDIYDQVLGECRSES